MPRKPDQIERTPGDLLKLRRFDEQEVIYRWRRDWWDGPINGLISYHGQRYWFDFHCDSEESGNPFCYLVFPLTEAEADFADAWSVENERFRMEWMPLGNDSATKDLPSTKEIAIKWKAHGGRLPNYSDRQPVAWFISGSNSTFYGIQVQQI